MSAREHITAAQPISTALADRGINRVRSKPQSQLERQKRAAARRAVDEVTDGMVVGLGTGSTAFFALEAIAERIAAGLHVLGVPTSERTAALANRLGIPLTTFASHRTIDLTIDGADEVDPRTLGLIKGRGGALLREKIVAAQSVRMIVIVDESKLVGRLGARRLLPVEIVSFGWQTVVDRLAQRGLAPRMRIVDGEPFVTDGANYIVDCVIRELPDPASFNAGIKAIPGIVETGLFLGLASRIIVGCPTGVEVIDA